MKKTIALLVNWLALPVAAQQTAPLATFTMYGDVIITVDAPARQEAGKEQLIILYALPNGNTTEQTMGKKLGPGDDWHFDIQHIKAQTAFIRDALPAKQITVVYLENSYKSWPLWKTKHPAFSSETKHLVDTIYGLSTGKKLLYLNGHSGGGRAIFNYLDAVDTIPAYVANISFLDSNYGYDTGYRQKLVTWLKANRKARLNVFAYNDSVALLDGKRIVSDTGGTWYRSHLMLTDLQQNFTFSIVRDDSLLVYQSTDGRIRFNLKANPDKKIFHTVQVERNGFIHSILSGTKEEEKRYHYFGERAYTRYIE